MLRESKVLCRVIQLRVIGDADHRSRLPISEWQCLLRCILSPSPSHSDLSLNLPCFVGNVFPGDCDDLVLIVRIAIDRCGQLSEESRHPRFDVGREVLQQPLIRFSID